jgi:hypothetical protein
MGPAIAATPPPADMPQLSMMSAPPARPIWWRQETFLRGLDLLNQGRFFAAHEALEEDWHDLAGRERQFVQGLIQVAVALHHHRAGNAEGAIALLDRAAQNLAPHADRFAEVDLAALRAALAQWLEFLARGGPEPVPVNVVRTLR